MFNNIALDVFIGLIFIYLLYSLLGTILQELIARAFNLRARMLQKSLRRMLEDYGSAVKPFWKNFTILAIFYDIAVSIVRFFNPKWDNEKFIKKFYNHPSIKYLGEDNTSSKPSYLHPQNFSQTMIQLLRGESYDGRTESESELIKNNLEKNTLKIKPETLRQLKNLFYDARQDSVVFKTKMEDWFNEMQERANGWYKKQTQAILIFTGFWVAFFFNVDTIAIYNILAKDKGAREGLVQMVVENKDKYAQTVVLVGDSVKKQLSDSILERTYEMLANDAEKANKILGLGKPWKDSCNTCKEILDERPKDSSEHINLTNELTKLRLDEDRIKKDSSKKDLVKKLGTSKTKIESELLAIEKKLQLLPRCKHIIGEMSKHCFKYSPNQEGGATTFFGWLITALAISLGAPFWFDLLNKLVQLRGTGPKPPATSTGTPANNNNSNPPATTGNPIRG